MKSDTLTRTAVRTALAMLFLAVAAPGHAEDLGRTIQVPLDYSRPSGAHAPLYFELGASFDRRKPVVIVVADGQQFYVRKGAVADLQKSIFGDRFNVVGIVGRGATDAFVKAARNDKGEQDWSQAWTIFRSEQWIGDIERVRKAVVGERGKIMLYGRSGGAYLVHQYLQRYGDHVSRAFTSSAVSPCHNRELGIPIDTYWDELAPELQTTLLRVLQKRASERLPILVTLQRQHFFVSTNDYPSERDKLIGALDRGDDAALARARKEYQVDDVLEMVASPQGLAQKVRVLEFLQPVGAFDADHSDGIYPLIQSQAEMLAPLLKLLRAGRISAPACELPSTHSTPSEIFVLAASRDEAVDYRTSIALASSYPKHELFIADDNHVFQRLTDAGVTPKIVQAFLSEGLGSPALQKVLADAESFRWTPHLK